ncbi:MAG: HU family DNA-binding protein [Candidatus Competibacteraceae bacterium]|nr:HU family DNA-binding protein [Candidatus Competibacteraceae bacterium]
MAIEAPSAIIASFKKIKDPFSNLQTGCEFTTRLSFVETQLNIQASIDGGAYVDCGFDIISNYPPAIRINGIVVPQDGLTHAVQIKAWHDDGSELSDEVFADVLVASFDMAPPPDPTGVIATILRDRDGVVPDQVRLTWVSDEDVDVYCLDDQGKKRNVAKMSESESSVILEDMTRYGTRDGTVHSYRFGVQAYNRSTNSSLIYADPVYLTASSADVVEPTPDDIAGTAVYTSHGQFLAWLDAQFPLVDTAQITAIWIGALDKIKDVVAKGGSVTLSDFGIFSAKWSDERTRYSNGTYTVIPASRSANFDFSSGFKKGVTLGQVMTDTEANA